MKIIWRDAKSLVPYARNARTHSDEQVAQIAASLVAFGWANPVLTGSDGGIIAGHGRLLGANKVWTDGVVVEGKTVKEIPNCKAGKIPCLDLEGLTDEQRRAYVIADNKIALSAGWNFELLRDELNELDAANFDLGLTGFAGKELEDLMAWSPDPKEGKGADESADYKEQWSVIIECDCERQQKKLLEEMVKRGLKVKALVA